MGGTEGFDQEGDPSSADGDTRRRDTVVPSSVEVLRTTVTRLREENDHLHQALHHRSMIEQAKGVLMGRMGIDADAAFARLRKLSQDANQRVTRIAAAIVASAEARMVTGSRPPDIGPFEWTEAAERDADVMLAGAALQQARDLDELARTLVRETARPFGVVAALVGALEPDGAVRLVAGHGYPSQVLSTWHRLPADLDIPLVAAARMGSPLFFSSREEREAAFPTTRQIPTDFHAQASLPLVAGGSIVGVIGLSWDEPFEFDDAARAGLDFVASSCTPTLVGLLHRDGDAVSAVTIDAAGARWFRAVLDSIVTPVALLEPIRDGDGRAQDFRFEYCNPATVDVLGRTGDELLGRAMVELYPDLVGAGVLEAFRRSFDEARAVRFPPTPVAHRDRDGVTRQATYEMGVSRLGDCLLLSWTAVHPTA